ncbi:hypothetical protein DI392_05455 [Vibrio albus]|uniref:O-antigen ligase domain-containing protein n=1 Tax=Vibrio albus TaxID=2200953 RepID=A0A2U3BCR9_9VIBR|nr:hypothetical protein [Vibrio albus]PWI34553.1 hypothetical protein DI392_05455 [Vibrio albus]
MMKIAQNDFLKTHLLYPFYRGLFFLLIWFIVFDGIRDSLVFSPYLSLLREATIALVFFSSLFTINFSFRVNYFSISIVCLFFIFVYGSVYSVSPIYPNLPSVSNSVTVLYKHFQFFMLLFSFMHIEKLTGKSIEHYAKLMVYLLFFASIITPLVYLHPPFFFKDNFLQWGRIGIGYPTMDAQVFCFGIVITLYLLDFSYLKKNVLVGTLVLGVLMQVTGTGFATLAFLIVFFVFIDKKNKLLSFSPLFFILFLTVTFVVSKFGDELKKILYLLNEKIDDLMNFGQGVSTEIRQKQFEKLYDIVSGYDDQLLLGIGSNIYVENQYSFFIIGFGLVGFIVFALYLLSMMFSGLMFIKYDKGFFLLSTVIFSLASYSLVSFYLYPLYSAYAFITSCHIVQVRRSLNFDKLKKN